MREIYLVRHGQASFGTDNYDKLSPLGHQQSVWLGEYFRERELTFDRVITGELVRQRETAESLCQSLGRHTHDFEIHSGLNEFDFQGVVARYLELYPEETPASRSDARAFFKALKKAVTAWRTGALEDNPGESQVESWQDFSDRVAEALACFQDSADKQRLLVVSSGGAMAMAISQILGAAPESVMELNVQIKNTSVNHLLCSPNAIRLTSFNHVPHLDRTDRFEAITYS